MGLSDKENSPWAATMLVAFMPWRVYNFEDAILVSEKAGQRGPATLPFILKNLKSKRAGYQAWTREITRIRHERSMLRDLDESGIIRSAKVRPGDVLVGR